MCSHPLPRSRSTHAFRAVVTRCHQVCHIFHQFGVQLWDVDVCNNRDLCVKLANSCSSETHNVPRPRAAIRSICARWATSGSVKPRKNSFNAEDQRRGTARTRLMFTGRLVLSFSSIPSLARSLTSKGSVADPSVSRFFSNNPTHVNLRDAKVGVCRWEVAGTLWRGTTRLRLGFAPSSGGDTTRGHVRIRLMKKSLAQTPNQKL